MLGERKDWDRGANQRGACFLGRDLTVLREELETVTGQGRARPHAGLEYMLPIPLAGYLKLNIMSGPPRWTWRVPGPLCSSSQCHHCSL